MKRFISNSFFKLKHIIHSLILSSIRHQGYTKKSKTHQLLCCSYEEFQQHLGQKPEGNIELDHICPNAQAQNEEELIKLQHYTNFRWLSANENNKKSDNWTPKGEELCKQLLNREWILNPRKELT